MLQRGFLLFGYQHKFFMVSLVASQASTLRINFEQDVNGQTGTVRPGYLPYLSEIKSFAVHYMRFKFE